MLIKELKIWLTAIAIPAFCWFVQIAQNDAERYHHQSVAFLANDRHDDFLDRGRALGLLDSTQRQQALGQLTAYYLLDPFGR